MSVHIDDIGDETPRPIDTTLVDESQFEKLGEGQGTVRKPSHSSARDEEDISKLLPVSNRTLIIMVVVALLVIAGIVFGAVHVLNSARIASEQAGQVERTVVPADGSVKLRDTTYTLAKQDKGYVLTATRDGAGPNPTVLGELHGTPVALVLYDGTILIPENLDDGTWDVAAYTIGLNWSKLMGQDGNPQGGKGVVTDAVLDGSVLRLTVDGSRVDVSLV